MRKPNKKDHKRFGFSRLYMVAGVSIFILVVLSAVIISTENPTGRSRRGGTDDTNVASAAPTAEAVTTDSPSPDVTYPDSQSPDLSSLDTVSPDSQSEENASARNAEIDRLYRENKLRVDDLDFWDMYSDSGDSALQDTDVVPEQPVASPTPKPTPEETDPSQDGKHTLVERRDGSSEWVSINPYITKNTYDIMNLKMRSDRMGYYEGERETSFFGVDISQYNGTVDFARLKEEEVDFVMIRLGARGYESGQIFLDENFTANIAGANEAGIDVGIYFFSQAVTAAEASEEAAYVLQHLKDRKVTYPVVFDMEYINNDTSRIEGISKSVKTEIARTFLNDIKAAGYIPMIYGTKEWLMEHIDLTKLVEYDIWLSQQAELPDYPYQFQMWQYTLKGRIAGISGDTDFNISFVDYVSR